jgi:Domain of unknown function (DUF4286)
MIVYNLSIKIAASVEKEWLQWQQQEHIPDVMASGWFTEFKFYKLLEQDDTDHATYVVQYFADSLKEYNNYIEQNAPLLRKKILDKWGDKFIAFRTVMEAVN